MVHDKETQKRLLEAVAKAKEHTEILKRKQESKQWASMTPPLKLAEGLARLTKDEMLGIARNLHISGVTALKKQELIDALQKRIVEQIDQAFLAFDRERYDAVKKLMRSGGAAAVTEAVAGRWSYFKLRGIVFTGTVDGKKVLVMPREITEAFERTDTASYAAIVRRNTDWVKLATGLLYYYGTLTLDEMVNMLTQYTGAPVSYMEYHRMMNDAVDYYRDIKIDDEGYSNFRVWDSKRVKQEHRSRPGLEFFPFTKSQLLQAGEPGFIDRNASYRSIVSFILEQYEIGRGKAEQIVEECVYAVRIGEPASNIMEYLQSQLELNDLDMLKSFMDRVVQLNNHTKQWFLKGHSPIEVPSPGRSVSLLPSRSAEIIDLATRKKIGRNDPCPCGSGLKFKKCCGK